MEVGDDEDYHFVLNAYGKSKYVVHIPTEIKALEAAFQKYHAYLNCFIVEPLLQGAGGMRMYDISFLKRARELCDQYDALLIFDEVATGFGRTGNRFVADLVQPDILVLGKALTGGYIGHAVTVANERVFRGFYDDNPDHALMEYFISELVNRLNVIDHLPHKMRWIIVDSQIIAWQDFKDLFPYGRRCHGIIDSVPYSRHQQNNADHRGREAKHICIENQQIGTYYLPAQLAREIA